MAEPIDTLELSPSRVHRRLMQGVHPAHTYGGGDVTAWQFEWRPKLWELLGLHRIVGGEPVDLNPRSLWKREQRDGLGTIEKLAFTAEPGADVVGYLCLPRRGLSEPDSVNPDSNTRGSGPTAPGSLPCFICLQGHSPGIHRSIACAKDEQTPEPAEGDRDFALGCMRRGVAALCIEQRSFGQRGEEEQARVSGYNTCHDAAMHALMLGRTLAGERVFDVMRSIDLLRELKRQRGDDLPIDPQRVGCMGNSGGGTVTLFAAAVDERVRYAMPSCGFCTYRDSIMSVYHCGDNYVPSLLLHGESADVAGLIAPRPIVIVNGTEDEIFPIGPAKREFERLKTIYEKAGVGGRCVHVVAEGGHRFYAEPAWDAMLPLLDD